MDFHLSQTGIKDGKRDTPLCLIVLSVILLVAIVLFAALPPYLTRHEYDEFNAKVKATGTSGGGTSSQESVEEDAQSTDPTLVHTQNGLVRGVETKGVRIFHGVPYAQPPIGPLRWEPPRKARSWSHDVYNATFMRSGCPQRCTFHSFCPRETSEDCLYLEIYTPLTASSKSQLPVLVYIHGGDFAQMSATSSIYDSSYLANRTGLVVVLMEYRLGALGFLAYADDKTDETVSNLGLLDQSLALQWVHDNIHGFGGDPNQVTLAGQSAGSQSILIHLQSSQTSENFRSVILESPPALLPLKTVSEGQEQARKFAHLAGCATSDTESKVDLDCLRNLSFDDVLEAQDGIKTYGSSYLNRAQPWGPVIDGTTVMTQILEAFETTTDNFWKPILWGVTAEEALVFVRSWFKHPLGPLAYSFATSILTKGLNSTLFNSLYPSTSEDLRDDMSLVATDFLFRCPMHWAAQKLHEKDVDSMWSYVWHKTLVFPESTFESVCNGRSCHGIEVPFVFHNFANVETNLTAEDDRVSNLIIDLYGNFVKYLNPNGEQDEIRHPPYLKHWPKAFISGKFRALGFTKSDTIRLEHGVSEERCRLWIDNDFRLGR